MKSYIWMFLFLAGFFFSCSEDGEMNVDELYERITKVEVQYLFDNVTYTYVDSITQTTDQISGVEHGAEFTSVAGINTHIGKTFISDFEGVMVLGKEITGYLEINLDNQHSKLNIDINQTRKFNSLAVGPVTEKFVFVANNIFFDKSYMDTDSGMLVKEFLASGDNACSKTTTLIYKESNSQYTNELFMRGCNSRAYIKVKAYFTE